MLRLLRSTVIAVLVLLPFVATAGLHEDMVALDRAYVPALAVTNQPRADTAKRAIDRLRTQWNAFRAAYPVAPAGFDAAAWKRAEAGIEAAIADAEAKIAAARLPDAHEALEHVREAQYTLRRGANMPYWLDDLTAFHTVMEKIAGAGAGKTAETLTDADVAAIRAALPEAERTWQQVLARRGDSARYGIAPDRDGALQKQLDAETQTLAALKAALANGDRGAIAKEAYATKPAFSKLFVMFGDFAPVTGG
jgi:hypothetical protein